jgi:hypothetical protein
MKKWCWQAKQYKKGWRLGIAVGNESPKYIPRWFSLDDIPTITNGKNTLYIHLAKDSTHCPEVKWSGDK